MSQRAVVPEGRHVCLKLEISGDKPDKVYENEQMDFLKKEIVVAEDVGLTSSILNNLNFYFYNTPQCSARC